MVAVKPLSSRRQGADDQVMTRIAINGFGRIGRNTLRALLRRDSKLEVVALNDLAPPEALAHLLRYDSALGRLGRPVDADATGLTVDGHRIRVFAEHDPAALPWADLDVDVVLEATGRFTAANLRLHFQRILGTSPTEYRNTFSS